MVAGYTPSVADKSSTGGHSLLEQDARLLRITTKAASAQKGTGFKISEHPGHVADNFGVEPQLQNPAENGTMVMARIGGPAIPSF